MNNEVFQVLLAFIKLSQENKVAAFQTLNNLMTDDGAAGTQLRKAFADSLGPMASSACPYCGK